MQESRAREKAAEIIAGVLEKFGPEGEKWIRGDLVKYAESYGKPSKNDKFCMIGAMNRVACEKKLQNTPARALATKAVRAAIRKHEDAVGVSRHTGIANFNDDQQSFAPIKEVLCEAAKELLNEGE